MSADCIFCMIAAGELPATTIYEDADVLAFMDIGPIVKGHALVIPRAHHATIHDTPDAVLSKVIAVVRRVARAQAEGLQADGVNVTQANGKVAGQVVNHIHFHVIPRFTDDHHSWNWTPRTYEDPEEMGALAARIRTALT